MSTKLTIPTLAEIQAKARADAVAEEKAKQAASPSPPIVMSKKNPVYIYIGVAAILIGGIYLINKVR